MNINIKNIIIMKRAILVLLSVIASVHLYAQDDDMYFSNKMDGEVEAVQTTTSARTNSSLYRSRTASFDNSKLAVYNSNSRDDDEYNRRYSFSSGYQTEGGADYSKDYESNDTVFNSDSLSYDDEDYYYSRRLLRFHSPRVAVALSSPYYWDLVYGYGIYDYMWDAYYDPFFYTWGWGYGWSWGPWSCWYGSFWGWHHPYAWSYWGWGPGWHGRYAWNHGRYSHRGGNFVNRDNNGGRIRTNALPNGGNASLSRGTFGTRNNGIASRSTLGNLSRDRVVPSRNRSALGNRTVNSRSSYSDYANTRTNNSVGNRSTQNPQSRSIYSRQSSTRSTTYSPNNSNRTYTPSRSTSAPSRSTYTPSRSSSNSTYSAPSRGGFGGGGGSFGGGGGSRGGGFSGGGSRGGGRR